jgi:DNA-directed RNA polymerase subunit RPC12/RpoP
MDKSSTHGLNCPQCGGIVPIPEGQVIVQCPYCDLRSFVRGERGLRRYQIPLRVEREDAIGAMRKFLSGNMAIARNALKEARLTEAFVVHLPFWTVWGRVAAWVFGEKKVGRGDNTRYQPRESRVVQDMVWNGAACDVGEFGVNQVPPVEVDLQPFEPDALHKSGMVFEPVNSFSEARQSALNQFKEHVRSQADLDRLAQLFIRTLRKRFGLVYHPLWVLRYLYRDRAYQITIDGYSGRVLYGKAPGNTLYRAAVLVLGMAFGAFLAIDIPALILSASDNGDSLLFVLGLFAAGVGIMFASYRAFRYGEQYEYRHGKSEGAGLPGLGKELTTSIDVKDVEKWINLLN